jgi:hypothetical protein
LSSSLEQARERDLLDESHTLAAVDSTGLESRHVSQHYLLRVGNREQLTRCYHTYAEVVDVRSHLCLGLWSGMGPNPDQKHFLTVMNRACHNHPFLLGVLADAGYDGEKYQKYLYKYFYEKYGVVAVVMPKQGLPENNPNPPRAFYRRFLYDHWPKELYHQRAQAETRMSMAKRLLGACLKARTYICRRVQIWIRSITLNLMIVAAAREDSR